MQVDDRLAVCTWSLQPTSCDDLIDKLRACGLERVQLHLDPIAEEADGWQDAADRLEDVGVLPVSGMVMCVGEDYSTIAAIERTGGIVPDDTWPATLDRMRKCAPVAGWLGLPLMTLHAGFIPSDRDHPVRTKVLDRVEQVADLFGEHECRIALETGQESASTLVDFLDELGRDDVGVNFDPANMLLYGSGDPVEALDRLIGWVKQVHLKDAIPSGKPGEWGTEVTIGKGDVDWRAFFSALEEAGYTGALPIEREAGDTRIDDIRAGADFIRSL